MAKDPEHGDKIRAVRARQRAIGRELRRIYDGVVSEPVPDEFLDLLRKIDESDGAAAKQTEKKS
ncbi:MAG TPA: NepR family anti-sigma factor [Rhizomicrobium sp.]|nr:NepR family anti-sigma factor [Rhizomicrobium sp.]